MGSRTPNAAQGRHCLNNSVAISPIGNFGGCLRGVRQTRGCFYSEDIESYAQAMSLLPMTSKSAVVAVPWKRHSLGVAYLPKKPTKVIFKLAMYNKIILDQNLLDTHNNTVRASCVHDDCASLANRKRLIELFQKY